MKITPGEVRWHNKAREAYVPVVFDYGTQGTLEFDVPIEYPRTGTHLVEASFEEQMEYFLRVGTSCNPSNWDAWRAEQMDFWANEKPGATVTKEFFDVLSADFQWKSQLSDFPANPNWARRTQDLKEFGYTLATNPTMLDGAQSRNCTHLQLLPLPRGGITGYETWSPSLRARIISVLDRVDVYEGKISRPEGLLPDHKFPEVRWDATTRRDTLEDLTDDDIRDDFQLLTNQRNLQKREVCRTCYLTGQRGTPFGIEYFYEGDSRWPESIPKRGEEAEAGCLGCGWYDMDTWRQELNKAVTLSKISDPDSRDSV